MSFNTFATGISSFSMAYDNAGHIYAANQNTYDIIKYDLNGNSTVFASLSNIQGIVFDKTYTHLYAIAQNDVNLYKYDLAGNRTIVSSSLDSANVWYGIETDNSGNVYYPASASDNTYRYIYKVNPAGNQTIFADLTSVSSFLGGIRFDSSGNLFVCDIDIGKVLNLNSAGSVVNANFITGLINPTSISFDPSGNLWLVDITSGNLNTYTSSGSPINVPYISTGGGLVGSTFDGSGNFYVSNLYDGTILTTRQDIPNTCFNEDTQILCSVGGADTYLRIQTIRKGTLVKTALNGYVPVNLIGTSARYNHMMPIPTLQNLYICSKDAYPELTQDLILTGNHSILVDSLTDAQREKTIKFMKDVFVTDNKYRLLSCLDPRAKAYNVKGVFNLWHLALDNDNIYKNYGIYANGLLVETASIRTMSELAGMKLV